MVNDEGPTVAYAEHAWYQHLREQWKPKRVRLLLVAESAPDPGAAATERRFFYAPTVSRADNLFRGVVLALYGQKVSTGDDRTDLLTRLQDDGVWLIDLAPYPVNHFGGRARRSALRDSVPARLDEILDIAPGGIVICHTPSYRALAPALIAAGAPLLHDQPIPFPLGNFRNQFAEAVRDAVRPLGFSAP